MQGQEVSPAVTCDWCGNDHDVRALCSARPKWTRRGFLALGLAAGVGAMLPTVPALNREFASPVTCALWSPLDVDRVGGITLDMLRQIAAATGVPLRFLVEDPRNA